MFSVPARCPALRGSPRCVAQRPLPSMMIATWRGTRPPVTGEMMSPRCSATGVSALAGAVLDLKELGLFLLRLKVQHADIAVRDLLELLLVPLQVILRDIPVFLGLAQLIVGMAANV